MTPLSPDAISKYERFLVRFVDRGWLHATRDSPDEQMAVNFGLRYGWLRKELSEAHFTPKGRQHLRGPV